MRDLLIAYAAGVLVGLWRTDGSPAAKLGLSLLWPLGPLAFLITVSGLILASAVALLVPGGSR